MVDDLRGLWFGKVGKGRPLTIDMMDDGRL
jgi:hypothetical protein